MDTIWDGNPSKSEIIGRCGGDEKRMTTQSRQRQTKQNKQTKQHKKQFKY